MSEPMHESDAWIDQAVSRMTSNGYREVEIDSPGLTGARALRRADFRVRWFFTRLHTFIVLLSAESVSDADVTTFEDAAVRWAARAKGGMPAGFQTGSAVLAVLVTCGAVSDGAEATAAERPRKRFARFGLPVLVKPSAGTFTTFADSVSWGAAYETFLAAQQERLLTGLEGRRLGSSGDGRAGRRVLMGAGIVGAVVFGVALTYLVLVL